MLNDMLRIKEDISRIIGSHVLLESTKGRSRVVVTKGVVEQVYPSIFTIAVDPELPEEIHSAFAPKKRKMTFSYADVLTRAVEITVL